MKPTANSTTTTSLKKTSTPDPVSSSSGNRSSNTSKKLAETRETLNILYEMSVLLNTGLDRETLAHCLSLCEAGVNPEALAQVVRELLELSRNSGPTVSQ